MNPTQVQRWAAWVVLLAATVGQTAPATRAARKPHDPKMWEAEIAKYEAADQKEGKPAAGGVVFVGSSSIRIWKVKDAFPGANVINRGFGGSWSCDSVYFADRVVTPYKPRTIVFYAGDNDIAGGQTAEEVAGCFEDFVKKVRAALPEVKIVFVSVKPSIARWALWPEMQRANAMVKAFAEKEKGVAFVDITREMLGEDGKPRKELLRADGLHMTDAGYAIWNEKVRGIVEETK